MERLHNGKLKKHVTRWEVQSISKVASWNSSLKDLSDVHSNYMVAQSWYREQTSFTLTEE